MQREKGETCVRSGIAAGLVAGLVAARVTSGCREFQAKVKKAISDGAGDSGGG